MRKPMSLEERLKGATATAADATAAARRLGDGNLAAAVAAAAADLAAAAADPTADPAALEGRFERLLELILQVAKLLAPGC